MVKVQPDLTPEDGAGATASGTPVTWLDYASPHEITSGTTTSRRRAAFALVLATIRFFPNTPTCHPISVSGNTIVRFGCGGTTNLPRTSLTMNLTAPRFLPNTPTHLPICISICAIVRISWPGRCNWHDWGNWLRNHNWWWCCLWTALVVHSAAPSLFVCCPHALSIDCAIEWVTSWHWTNGTWPWWESHRGRWWRCWRCCWSGLWECCR